MWFTLTGLVCDILGFTFLFLFDDMTQWIHTRPDGGMVGGNDQENTNKKEIIPEKKNFFQEQGFQGFSKLSSWQRFGFCLIIIGFILQIVGTLCSQN